MFRTEPIADQTDAGQLLGIQREIACLCWFTQGGRTLPKTIKAMDQEGEIHRIPVLEVLSSEEKHYSGIATTEYICKIVVSGREVVVKLILDKLSSKWKLIQI